MDAALSWSAHIHCICSKTQLHIYFLSRLRPLGANTKILLLFSSLLYRALQRGSSARCGCLSVRLDRLVSAQSLWVKRLSQIFKLHILKECCVWLVILRQTPLIFDLKNIKFFHQTEDLEPHSLDRTDCRTLVLQFV